ncbi:MAG TPA: hypothetical protein VFS02_10620 [Telluria sp.]|nr:hypothetical protein [Telluria sp.]
MSKFFSVTAALGATWPYTVPAALDCAIAGLITASVNPAEAKAIDNE